MLQSCKNGKEMYKKCDAHEKVLFCLSNLFFFFFLHSLNVAIMSLDLKVPDVAWKTREKVMSVDILI